MYYATRKLHLPQGEVLSMYVVEIVGGVVQGWFPFDGERQSMLWEDELFLSCNPDAKTIKDISREVPVHGLPLCLYVLCGVPVADAPVMRVM